MNLEVSLMNRTTWQFLSPLSSGTERADVHFSTAPLENRADASVTCRQAHQTGAESARAATAPDNYNSVRRESAIR